MMGSSEDEYAQLEGLARDVLAECRSALMMRFCYLDVALWKMPFEAMQCSSVLASDGQTLGFNPVQTLVNYYADPAKITRELLHSILHCIFRQPFDKQHGLAPAWHLTCDILVESIALEMCEERYATLFDDARKIALGKIEAVCGSLSPKKLYRMFSEVFDFSAPGTPPSLASEEELREHHNEEPCSDCGMLSERDGLLGSPEPYSHSETSESIDFVLDAGIQNGILDACTAGDLDAGWCDEGTLIRRSAEALASHGYFTISDLYFLAQLFSRDSHDRWASKQKDTDPALSDKAQDSHKSEDTKDQSQVETKSHDEDNVKDEERPLSEPEESEDQGEQSSSSQDIQQDMPDSEESIQIMFDADRDQTIDDLQTEAQNDLQVCNNSSSVQDNLQKLDSSLAQTEQEWQDIARQIELDLEASSLSWSSKTGHLCALLPVVNRKRYDYSKFLKQFVTLNETIKVSDDEFDYIFYTYGLKACGNRPLIEPLEYQDAEIVRDFVIALDTSGSCEGELVRQFVQKTFDLLKDGESFASKVNVHIIQCDASIQSDTKIQTKEDLKYFMDNFELRGFGGTDFRPVFAYVDELVQKEEFTDLRGLLYFTDGLGIYPEYCPSYETAFIFMDDDMVTPKVPPWAMKVVLDEDEVRQF